MRLKRLCASPTLVSRTVYTTPQSEPPFHAHCLPRLVLSSPKPENCDQEACKDQKCCKPSSEQPSSGDACCPAPKSSGDACCRRPEKK